MRCSWYREAWWRLRLVGLDCVVLRELWLI
jgi:hypothetical protein